MFRIIPILGEATTSETLPLADFYVVHLKNKKEINSFLKKIPMFLAKFNHLKRVDRTGGILVQRVGTLPVGLLDALREFGVKESDMEIVKVPSVKPMTRQQFDWAKQYWPTCFHPDKELESLMNNTSFTEKDKQRIYEWCERAHQVGSIVVQFQNDEELACGHQTYRLLSHSVMTMVQKLAKCPRREGDYLATNCDVYLKDEPCAMCAMLSLGSWQLHLEPSINHHYRVFQVTDIAEEGSAVCGK
ncbi:unnamed protein product [Strongylus vulgaris]|uniref:CMP/dCMP-type deaminase domain-containing protein n=1 Tax=Strongylus vulgaris TaxID=40348 RepID=A0A3P7HXU8_STRVU|nr:unnamed protein product [Strongylus vulgaris]